MASLKRWVWVGLARVAVGIGVLLVLLIITLTALAFWPMGAEPLTLGSLSVESFEAASAEVAKLKTEVPSGIRPECLATVFDHGHKTERVYLLMHGLTNCPAQFREFGELLHASGANVLIPRLPYHGLGEGLDDQQKNMTAESVLEMAGFALDLAHGYGERITVIGLSVNGTTAAWLAQTRPDIDTAMIIAPFFAPNGVDSGWIAPVTRLIARLPNVLVWWDPRVRDALEGPEHAYPRFATHPIAGVMWIGLDLFKRAENGTPPAAKRIIFVNSEADIAISLARVNELVGIWEKTAPGRVSSHVFPLEMGIPHDCIDPAQPDAQIDIVYPMILEWLNND